MPHRCVRCSAVYPSQSQELMSGCTCGSRVFLFIRDENEPSVPGVRSESTTPTANPVQTENQTSPASKTTATPLQPSPASGAPQESESESRDYGWLEDELAFLSKDKPVSVDVESVENLRILEKGAYELDLPSLMKGEPLVIKSDKHVYYVKIPRPKGELQ